MNILTLLTLLIAFVTCEVEFDIDKAKTYAYASALVYCPLDKIKNNTCGMAGTLTLKDGMELLHSFSNNASYNPIQYIILKRKKEKEIVISFSGTQNPEQLLLEMVFSYNVKYVIHPTLGGNTKVMEYFYYYYVKQFRGEFEEQIPKWHEKYPNYKFVFVGHSLGGAMTVNAAVDSLLSKWVPADKIAVYTYGQPRVGEKGYTDVLQQASGEVFRVIHNRDLVAHIPF